MLSLFAALAVKAGAGSWDVKASIQDMSHSVENSLIQTIERSGAKTGRHPLARIPQSFVPYKVELNKFSNKWMTAPHSLAFKYLDKLSATLQQKGLLAEKLVAGQKKAVTQCFSPTSKDTSCEPESFVGEYIRHNKGRRLAYTVCGGSYNNMISEVAVMAQQIGIHQIMMVCLDLECVAISNRVNIPALLYGRNQSSAIVAVTGPWQHTFQLNRLSGFSGG